MDVGLGAPAGREAVAGSRPSYLRLHGSGELHERARAALGMLAKCRVCPRDCDADRLLGEIGACRTGRRARVASAFPHFGEESVLSGRCGSGTIFFSFCNMACVFCQNWEISHQGEGVEVEAADLAALMLALQGRGCHNINLVTPSHVVPQILEALQLAVEGGLRIPLVYNTGGYDSLETLRLLEDVVDIYMPDVKWASEANARRYSRVTGYPAVNRAAIGEMHRQVGDLQVDENGVAVRGLLVRHLVMPGGLAGSDDCLRFVAGLSPNSYVNVMGQYRPAGFARRFAEIDRPAEARTLRDARASARSLGLVRGLDR